MSVAELFMVCAGITLNTFTFLLGLAVGSAGRAQSREHRN